MVARVKERFSKFSFRGPDSNARCQELRSHKVTSDGHVYILATILFHISLDILMEYTI